MKFPLHDADIEPGWYAVRLGMQYPYDVWVDAGEIHVDTLGKDAWAKLGSLQPAEWSWLARKAGMVGR